MKSMKMFSNMRYAFVALALVPFAISLTHAPVAAQGSDAAQQKVVSRNSEMNGYNRDLYVVQGAKVKPGGTADDPENLASYGYNQHWIRNIYKMRSIDAYCHEAKTLAKGGDLAGALALYLKTRDLSTTYLRASMQTVLAGLADVYTAQGQTEKAVDTLRQCVYFGGGHPSGQDEVLAKYALLLHQTGQYEEALTIYQMALDGLPMQKNDPLADLPVEGTNGNTSFLPFGANLILVRDGVGSDSDYDNRAEAVTYARAAVKLRPNTAIGHFYLGLALNALNSEPGRDAAAQAAATEESQAEYDKAYKSGSRAVKILVDKQLGRWTTGKTYQ